jgi:hypothetical protein
MKKIGLVAGMAAMLMLAPAGVASASSVERVTQPKSAECAAGTRQVPPAKMAPKGIFCTWIVNVCWISVELEMDDGSTLTGISWKGDTVWGDYDEPLDSSGRRHVYFANRYQRWGWIKDSAINILTCD